MLIYENGLPDIALTKLKIANIRHIQLSNLKKILKNMHLQY